MADTGTERKKAYKDWFDADAARALSAQLSAVYTTFDKRKFQRLAVRNLQDKEFSERVQQFSDALADTLPADYEQAVAILTSSLPAPLPDCEAVTDGWLQWPVGQFIADHGIDHFDASFAAMTELTRRFSSEFAVRPFVEHHPDRVFAELQRLTSHECPHVRRWCSEGVRTRLPWGQKLHALISKPEPILPILDALKDDPELYVRKSVANNLNDLTKDHPQLVKKLLRGWSRGASEQRKWLIRQALRGLVKQGDKDALAILGYKKPDSVRADIKVTPKTLPIGGDVVLSATIDLESGKSQALLVDYVVHYRSKASANKTGAAANERSSRQKVFKWKSLTMKPGKPVTLTKKHSFKVTSIRALYPGIHKLELQINGYRTGSAQVKLVER